MRKTWTWRADLGVQRRNEGLDGPGRCIGEFGILVAMVVPSGGYSTSLRTILKQILYALLCGILYATTICNLDANFIGCYFIGYPKSQNGGVIQEVITE
jgi:hypothetical protein